MLIIDARNCLKFLTNEVITNGSLLIVFDVRNFIENGKFILSFFSFYSTIRNIIEKEKTRNMQKLKKTIKVIFSLMTTAVLILILVYVFDIYKQNSFKEFGRAELNLHTSEFKRDKNVQYTKGVYSYRITSNVMNDATLFKELAVEKNTPYKVSCMVKTKNVVAENDNIDSGAHISIIDTVEKSKSIQGTNEWQELVFYFNSYDRESVNIGFRLGGYQADCTGTAWFSDFKVEKGVMDADSVWNVACFVIPYTDVILDDGVEVAVKMSQSDIYNTKSNMERFKNSCYNLSGGLMSVEYDFFETNATLTSVTYDEANGNYIAAEDVAHIIDPYLEKENYDHIFIVARLGDSAKNVEIQVKDWIGLGGMQYRGIGFSNIRIPNESYNAIYSYNSVTNTFPEEVMIHEFLHDLERICGDMNYEIPELHDYEKYGFRNESIIGQKKWYEAYMSRTIYDGNSKSFLGLDSRVYKIKPANEDNFEYSLEVDFIKEPENIIEEMSQIFKKTYNFVMTKIERAELEASEEG